MLQSYKEFCPPRTCNPSIYYDGLLKEAGLMQVN